MTTRRPFRFGVTARNAKSRHDWVSKARKIEDLGYSILLVPDHFDREVAPFAALMAAADATTTLRVGSSVFDNDFRHPAVLAREAATLDMLSEGRFELGLGAGYLAADYERVGIRFDSPGVRIERLEESLRILKGLYAGGPLTFSGKYYTLKEFTCVARPFQKPHMPIYLGGGGKAMLSLAGRYADIAGIGPKAKPDGHLDMADTSAQATARKIAWIRQAAADRFEQIELSVFIMAVAITHDRQAAAQQVAGRFGAVGEQLLDTPHALVDSIDELCDLLWQRREEYGFSYIVVQEERMETLAPIVARLSGK